MSSETPFVLYHTDQADAVPDDHWSVKCNRVRLGQPDNLRVALFWWREHDSVDEIPVVVRLNPDDARGHRIMATVTDERDPRRTFSRPASPEEDAALGAALALLKHAFHRLGCVGQTYVLGNNSHGCGGSGTVMTVGRETDEPSLIHGHVVGRGPPGADPVASGVPLRSPPPGDEFVMRGRDGQEKGRYGEGEAEAVAASFRKELGSAELTAIANRIFRIRVEVPE